MKQDYSNVNEIILEKIDKANCDESIKKFLKTIIVNEFRRKKGEEFVKLYLHYIEKFSQNKVG